MKEIDKLSTKVEKITFADVRAEVEGLRAEIRDLIERVEDISNDLLNQQ